MLAVGGVGYYVKIVRPKQQAEDDEDFEDDGYGEGFDPDEAYGEPEYLSEDDFDDRCREMLNYVLAECASQFEKLPCIEDAEILRNILYAGVWSSFDKKHKENNIEKQE